MKSVVKILFCVCLSLGSIVMFFLIAEGITRFYDSNFSETKISGSEDDGTSRLRGYSLDKPADVYRILVLGDSITYGQGVRWDNTYPKQLEILLNKGQSSKKFEVINTGVCGIDTTQELYILLNQGPFPSDRPEMTMEGFQGLAYSPDMLLLQYTVSNDAMTPVEFLPPQRPKRFGPDGVVRRQNYGDYALPLPDTIDKWLTMHSRFYLFFLVKYHGFLSTVGLRNEQGKVMAMYQPNAIGWQRTRLALRQIADICRSKNIPAIMILWSTDNSLAEERQIVKQFAISCGYTVIDFGSEVIWPKENLRVSNTDPHPNTKAHRVAAEALYKFLNGKNF